MPNKHMLDMSKYERLAAVVDSYREDHDVMALAKAGLDRVEGKHGAKARSVRADHVVWRIRQTTVGKGVQQEVVRVDEYLTDRFEPGTAERMWGSAYEAHYFRGKRDAERAALLKGAGVVQPVSAMSVPGDQLGKFRSEGIGRSL